MWEWEFSRGTTLTSSPGPGSGPRLAPRKGLAQNRQGSVQSHSLVWQKAPLGSSPLLSRGQDMWQLTRRDTLLGREWQDGGEGKVGRTQ